MAKGIIRRDSLGTRGSGAANIMHTRLRRARLSRHLGASGTLVLAGLLGCSMAGAENSDWVRSNQANVSAGAAAFVAASDTVHTTIGQDGKLDGPLSGYAWVHGSPKTDIASPSPCNMQGCFRNTNGQLCSSGTVHALACQNLGTPAVQCDWTTHYGTMIGLNTTVGTGPWGRVAPKRVAFAYHGKPASYRLTAHVFGDPDSKIYCMENYTSGAPITASDLRSECWSNTGKALSSIEQVDRFTLMVLPTPTEQPFDYCITDILSSNAEPPRMHTSIAADGKLAGVMNGYAWVHGSTKVKIDEPASCNQSGCFKQSDGHLCTAGSMRALSCTNEGTPQMSCDWTTHYGTMIGLNPDITAGQRWGAHAPSQLAVSYDGGPGQYRLAAHVAGDPDSTIYCVENYASGVTVTPGQFRTECWSDKGKPLANLQDVDRMMLMLMPTSKDTSFRYCINDILSE